MRAVYCTAYGPPDVLEMRQVPVPQPGAGEVLVRVRATTVTAGDVRMRTFTVPRLFWLPGRLALGWRRPKLPVLGMEFAGEVTAVGENVRRFRPGDAVYGASGHVFGAYADYKVAPAQGGQIALGRIAHKPAGLSFEQAAAVPVGAITANGFLRAAAVRPGMDVLIYGASGSVGSYAVQIARQMGATVTAVCSGGNADLVRGLGAERVIDYTCEDFRAGDARYDVIFDAVGKIDVGSCRPVLRPDGAFAAAAMTPLQGRWLNRTSGRRVLYDHPHVGDDDLAALGAMLDAGQITPVIDRRYPLEAIRAAHAYVETGRKRGNVVITL